MTKLIDEESYKGVCSVHTPGGTQSVKVVLEPGVYQILARTGKKEAKPFQKKLYEEVLPQIRKTGLYNPLPFRLSDDSALVSFEGEDYWVKTTTIAEMFDKEHRNVVRDFQQAQEDYSNALKFERIEQQAQEDYTNALKSEGIKDEANELPKFKMIESSYVDAKGRTQRAFKVNRPRCLTMWF
jgi:prophage antirepressor-like protein